jgi:16S rRNA (cytidine1402-2'-O)-methyltransferase
VTRGTLFIIPVPLAGDDEAAQALPEAVLAIVRGLERFIAEDAKSARAFLKAANVPRPISEIEVHIWTEHSITEQVSQLIAPLIAGGRIGLLSEAGYPAAADPGADIVAAAHRAGVKVVPLVGPSSLLLALAASGLNGQRFCFHGYLPVPEAERARALLELEARSRQDDATQLFIEAPYRNNQLLETLLRVCSPATRLCIAAELTSANENVCTQTVAEWSTRAPDLHRRPTVFLLQADPHDVSAASAKRPNAAVLRRRHSRTGARSARRGSPSE